MKIRPYSPTDRTACLDIFNSNLPRYFAPEELDLLINWLNAKDKNETAYKSNIAEHFYVLETEGTVNACGGFYIDNNHHAKMTWGMVHNGLHGTGLGKALLLDRLKEIGKLYPGCSVALDTSQHTYGFFEKLGFKVTKITKDGYGEGLDRYDMVS